MNILYVSAHSVLQQDESKLLRELGHKLDIVQPSDNSVWINLPKYDIILVCHRIDWLNHNFSLINLQRQKIIYRSIGQSTPELEHLLTQYRQRGILKICRYSPQESLYINYAGSDGLVRFSKNPDIYHGWQGTNKHIVMFANHIWNRPQHCKLKYMEMATQGFNCILHGWDNKKINTLPTQELNFDDIPSVLRDARVLLFCGTFPASYTLNFTEALMTGTPIVSIGSNMFYEGFQYFGDVFEVPDILDMNSVDYYNPGFWSNNIDCIRHHLDKLLTDDNLAERCSKAAQEIALNLFSEEVVKKQWKHLLESL